MYFCITFFKKKYFEDIPATKYVCGSHRATREGLGLFYSVSPRGRAQVVRLGTKHLYPLCHPIIPQNMYFMLIQIISVSEIFEILILFFPLFALIGNLVISFHTILFTFFIDY